MLKVTTYYTNFNSRQALFFKISRFPVLVCRALEQRASRGLRGKTKSKMTSVLSRRGGCVSCFLNDPDEFSRPLGHHLGIAGSNRFDVDKIGSDTESRGSGLDEI